MGFDFFGGEWLRHGDASFCSAVNEEVLGLIMLFGGLRTECRREKERNCCRGKRTYLRFTFTSLRKTEELEMS